MVFESILAGAGGGAVISIIINAIDKTGSVLSRINKNMLALGAGITAVGIAGGVALFSLAKDASNLEESVNAMSVAFGDSAEEILEIGKNAARSFGLSRRQFNEGAVAFSAFAEIIAGDGGNVADVIGRVTGRVSDFASVFNIDVDRAQVLFQAGLAGETEGLRRFGIDVSAATVKVFALANGISDGTKELTEQEKILARYGVIMEQTNKVQDDFKNTSDGLANRQRILKASVEDLRAELGTALLPAFEEIVSILQKGIDLFSGLTDKQKKWLVIGSAVAVVLALIVGPMLIMVSLLPAIFAGFVLLFSTIGILIGLFTLLAAGITFQIIKHETLKEGILLAWNTIVKNVERSINFIIRQLNRLRDLINKIPGVNLKGFEEINLDRFEATIKAPTPKSTREGDVIFLGNINGISGRDIARELEDEMGSVIRL